MQVHVVLLGRYSRELDAVGLAHQTSLAQLATVGIADTRMSQHFEPVGNDALGFLGSALGIDNADEVEDHKVSVRLNATLPSSN